MNGSESCETEIDMGRNYDTPKSEQMRVSAVGNYNSEPSFQRQFSSGCDYSSHKEPDYVVDMPLKKNIENSKIKQKQSSRNSGKKEIPKLEVIADLTPVFETAISNEAPQKAKLGFGKKAPKNSKFLDQDYSEEGIEIYIKGNPPVKRQEIEVPPHIKPPQERNFEVKSFANEQQSNINKSFLDIARKSVDLYKEPIPQNKITYSVNDIVSQENPQVDVFTPRSGIPRESPQKEAYFELEPRKNFHDQKDNSTSEKSDSSQKVIRFAPNRSSQLKRSPSKEEVYAQDVMPVESVPIDDIIPRNLTPTKITSSPDYSEEGPNSGKKKNSHSRNTSKETQVLRESVALELEDNFEKVIENVSKIDSKKRLQDQINSSYAIIEVKD